MSVCSLDHGGEMLLHRPMQSRPDALRKALAPSRDHRVVAAAWLCTWDWRADWCAAAGLPFGLGQALDLKALHGGQANNDTMDAQNMAGLLRGGLRPQADVSPAAMRATRARLRRRRPLAHTWGERWAHGQTTNRQSTLPAIGTHSAYTATRDGVAARVAAPAGHQRLAVDLARIDYDAPRLRD